MNLDQNWIEKHQPCKEALMGLTGFTYSRFINARRRLQTAVTAILAEEKGRK